jgi:hypothetical protein
MSQKGSFFHSAFRLAQYRPYPFFPLLQLWLAKILSTFFYNKHNGLLPLTSAPSSQSSDNPEQGGSNLLWNIRISLYYLGWTTPTPHHHPPPKKNICIIVWTANLESCELVQDHRPFVLVGSETPPIHLTHKLQNSTLLTLKASFSFSKDALWCSRSSRCSGSSLEYEPSNHELTRTCTRTRTHRHRHTHSTDADRQELFCQNVCHSYWASLL